MIAAFRGKDIEGKKILLPRAAEARPILPIELKKMGADVDEVPVYHTRAVHEGADLVLDRLEEKTIDIITFTSSSTARNFKSLLPPEKFEALMKGITTVSIGPITADTARDLGFDVHIVAETFTIPGLCDAILGHYHP